MDKYDSTKNISLLDEDGEIWEDVIGYDGSYSISNYGRVKSERRYNSIGRLVKERILKQGIWKQESPSVQLYIHGIGERYTVQSLVGNAFKGDKLEGEVYYHKNKIKVDNRAENIIKDSYSASIKVDFKIGVKKAGLGEHMKSKARVYLNKVGIFKDGILIGKTCVDCLRKLPINNFYEERKNRKNPINIHSTKCKECILKLRGVKEVGKQKERRKLAELGLKYCYDCEKIKTFDAFHNNKAEYTGKSKRCKECVSRAKVEWRIKNRRKI